MIIVIAKNNNGSAVGIESLGLSIPAFSQRELVGPDGSFTFGEISTCAELHTLVYDGDLVINDGTSDLSIVNALDHISGDKIHAIIEGPKDISGKLRVQQSSRPLGLSRLWMGEGDDPSDINAIGGGQAIMLDHTATDPITETIYIDFNTIGNETWIHESNLMWQNANFDRISASVVPRVPAYEASSETNYAINSGLIVPAAGNGTIALTGDITNPHAGLVRMHLDDVGIQPPGFWNADWNPTTGLYENITAAPAGDGLFNMFAAEVELTRFYNNVLFLGDGFQPMKSSDIDRFGQGMRLRITFTTNGSHEWQFVGTLILHRKRLS